MLVRALNINHVHRVAKLLEEYFPVLQGRVGAIHSEHESYDLAGRPSEIINRFYNGEHWVIVHCGLFGVGFDHKWVSVSCCLCVLKSMSPAEQEWGRALRRVPGPPPGQFPELTHPNWAVVVTHEALKLRELFEKFQTGVTAEAIKDAPIEKPVRPRLVADYQAGETVLKLSNTVNVKPGDVLELRVPVAVEQAASPKFSLVDELRATGNLSEDTETEVSFNGKGSFETNATRLENYSAPPAIELQNCPTKRDTLITPQLSASTHSLSKEGVPLCLGKTSEQLTLLPWQQEADAVAHRLAEIRSVRTYQVQVSAVLDGHNVQIDPAWCDIPRRFSMTKQDTLIQHN